MSIDVGRVRYYRVFAETTMATSAPRTRRRPTPPITDWDFGDLDLRLDRARPAVGQHTTEALTELGLAAEEINARVAAGAAGDQGA